MIRWKYLFLAFSLVLSLNSLCASGVKNNLEAMVICSLYSGSEIFGNENYLLRHFLLIM